MNKTNKIKEILELYGIECENKKKLHVYTRKLIYLALHLLIYIVYTYTQARSMCLSSQQQENQQNIF